MTPLPPVPPKHSLGQNFLIDPNIARKLVGALDPQPDETVLEIGPGVGALTAVLLERATRVIAVEIDGRLIPGLRERFGEQLDLLHADILAVDLTELATRAGGRLALLSCLPYYASSPILFHLLKHRAALSRAVLTLQREVADRCCAKPGTKDYGGVSVQLALAASPRRLFTISPHVFRPRPKVESAALLLDFTRPHPAQPRSWDALEQVLRAAFGQRRKTLRNALSAKFDFEKTDEMLAAAGVNPKTRAEDVPPEGFVALAESV
jgi:16S rRNA (adenine1518-N6/adenine1519-N6)-dimethyltransferase